MGQHPALSIIRRKGGVLRSCVLGVLCCMMASALYGQTATPTPGQTGAFWSESQRQIYLDAKAILDRGEKITSRLRRSVEEVCDQLTLSMLSDQQATERGKIRDLLIDVDTLCVKAVTKHLLAAEAPDEARLYGIIILVNIADTERPKDAIISALNDLSPAVRLWAIRGAIKKGYTEAEGQIISLLLDESPEVRLTATRAVESLKPAGAESHLVAMLAREAERRTPLTAKLTDLQKKLKALEGKAELATGDQQQIDLLKQRIDELSGRISFINLLIYRAGLALSALTNGTDGLELKGALSSEELQKVIDNLRQKYGETAS